MYYFPQGLLLNRAMLTKPQSFAYVDPFARDWPGFSTTDTGVLSCFCIFDNGDGVER